MPSKCIRFDLILFEWARDRERREHNWRPTNEWNEMRAIHLHHYWIFFLLLLLWLLMSTSLQSRKNQTCTSELQIKQINNSPSTNRHKISRVNRRISHWLSDLFDYHFFSSCCFSSLFQIFVVAFIVGCPVFVVFAMVVVVVFVVVICVTCCSSY